MRSGSTTLALLSLALLIAAPSQAQGFKDLAKGLLTGQQQQQQPYGQPYGQQQQTGGLGGLIPGLGGGGNGGALGGILGGGNAQGQFGQTQMIGAPNLNNAQGVLTGNTSLPPGGYSVTNMQTGQSFYLNVVPGGQTFAIDPQAVQQGYGQPGMPGSNPNTYAPQTFKQQMGSTLMNVLQNKMNPAAPVGGMGDMAPQQY